MLAMYSHQNKKIDHINEYMSDFFKDINVRK